MATGDIPSLALESHLYVEDHMTVNLLVTNWCLVVAWELKSTVDRFHLFLNRLLPKVGPQLPIKPKCFCNGLREEDPILVSSIPMP